MTDATMKNEHPVRALVRNGELLAQLERSLPRGNGDRFLRAVETALLRTPKLLNCTRQSIVLALHQLAALGLEPDGRRAHLIPRKDQCTLIVDYKGLVELVMRAVPGTVIQADVVYAGDSFRVRNGQVDHVWGDIKDRAGTPVAAWCGITMPGSPTHFEVMTIDEIESVRKRGASGFGSRTPWDTDYGEMAKKTVSRRALKWAPLTAEAMTALEADDPIDVTPPAMMLADAPSGSRIKMSRRLPATGTVEVSADAESAPPASDAEATGDVP